MPVVCELVEGSETEGRLAVKTAELIAVLRRSQQQPCQGNDEEDGEEHDDGDREHPAEPASRSGRRRDDAQISRGQRVLLGTRRWRKGPWPRPAERSKSLPNR